MTIIIFKSKDYANTLLATIEGHESLGGVSVTPVEYNTSSDGRVCIAHPFSEDALVLFKNMDVIICDELPADWVISANELGENYGSN